MEPHIPVPRLPRLPPPPRSQTRRRAMRPAAPPRGWTRLEDRFYRVLPLRGRARAPPLAGALVCAAGAAGPVALIPDGGWGLNCALEVHSAAGDVLARYAVLRGLGAGGAPVRAVAVGWAPFDVAVVVYEDGLVVRATLPAAAVERARIAAPVSAVPDDPLEVENGKGDGGGGGGVGENGGGEVVDARKVFDAAVLPQGQVVVRTVGGRIYVLGAGDNAPREVLGPRVPPPVALCAERGGPPGGMLVATARGEGAGDVEVLVIGVGGTMARFSASSSVPVAGEHVHVRLALSPDGKFVAAVLTDGHVVVRNVATLVEVVNVIIPAHLLPVSDDPYGPDPDDVAWVGPDAVAVTYSATVLLVGPGGEVTPVTVCEDSDGESRCDKLVLHTESDGLRVTSKTSCVLVQMVPDCIEAVFLRHDAPSNKLLRASACSVGGRENEKRADELAQSVEDGSAAGDGIESLERYRLLTELRDTGALLAAAKSCVEAAYFAWDADDQKALLTAATYGQRYEIVLGTDDCDRGDASGKVPHLRRPGRAAPYAGGRGFPRIRDPGDCGVPLAIATMRVMFAAQSQESGVPLTKPQLDSLGFEGLVRRLSGYGRHAMALRLSAFCGISPNTALTGWARERLHSTQSDQDVARQIGLHFEETRRMFEVAGMRGQYCAPPFVHAARDAYEYGRGRCAEFLLRREPNAAAKVPLYLDMRLESLALVSAIASKDYEVIMSVIEHLLENKTIRELASLFKALPASMSHRVTDLLVVHLREKDDSEGVHVLLTEVGRYREAAMEAVADADKIQDDKARLLALEKAASHLSRWSHRRSNVFELQALQQTIAAAQISSDVEKRSGLDPGALQGKSSTEVLSVATCVADPARRRDLLTRIRRDLNIPERRFFWVVLEALANAGDVSAVEALSNSAGHGRPPPIGYMAFVDVCLQNKQESEAMKYAMRIADLRDRARALARCGRGKEAADIASKLRNNQLLEEVSALVARHSSGLSMSVHPASLAARPPVS